MPLKRLGWAVGGMVGASWAVVQGLAETCPPLFRIANLPNDLGKSWRFTSARICVERD